MPKFPYEPGSRNIPEKNTNHGESSKMPEPVDWKGIKGIDRPYESREDSLDPVNEGDSGEDEKGESE